MFQEGTRNNRNAIKMILIAKIIVIVVTIILVLKDRQKSPR